MLKTNKFSSVVLFAALCSLSMSAFAGSLTIVNNSSHDSTSIINRKDDPNHPLCSNTLPGGVGVTKAHSTNVIKEGTINVACVRNKTNCTAEVYMTNNCTGSMVAMVSFDTKSGIKQISTADSSYVITGSGFYIMIDVA